MPDRDSQHFENHGGRWLALGVLLLLALVAGAWIVARAPVATGDAYPPYSSLRTDPLGAKALYESLQSLPEVSVSRAFRASTALDPQSALLLLGVQAANWPGKSGRSLTEYEQLLTNGGRLVIGFLPVNPRRDRGSVFDQPVAGDESNKPNEDQRDVNQRWNLRLQFRARDAGEEVVRGQLPRHTALSFDAGPEWRVIAKLRGQPVAVERKLGSGSVVLIAETYPLSNEGLRDGRNAALVAEMLGSARRIVFDEDHLGVSDSGSVAGLMRKYHLEGAIGALLLAALLFIWRSASSFLPPVAPLAANSISGERDAHHAMAALLRRSATEKQLMETCQQEWMKSSAKSPRAGAADKLVSEVIQNSAGSGPVETYRAVCLALSAKTKMKMTEMK